jgi:hypothetical protein
MQKPGSFISWLQERWETPLIVKPLEGDASGYMTTLLPSSGTDVAYGLWIEELDDEVTIGFDYSHSHYEWPPQPRNSVNSIWWNPSSLLEAILAEKIVAHSGWKDGELRVGAFDGPESRPDFSVPNLQRLRVRSWLGTFNRDVTL